MSYCKPPILHAIILFCPCSPVIFFFFFFNDTATTEIYTLSLHDALPISKLEQQILARDRPRLAQPVTHRRLRAPRSEEHTSELQSQSNLVCRLLLEKKKKYIRIRTSCVSTKQMFLSLNATVTISTQSQLD